MQFSLDSQKLNDWKTPIVYILVQYVGRLNKEYTSACPKFKFLFFDKASMEFLEGSTSTNII